MKKSFLILIVFLATTMVASAQQVSDYFTLPHVGDYRVFHADSLVGQPQPSTIREHIEGVDMILGEEYFRQSVSVTADADSSLILRFYIWFSGDSTGGGVRAFGDTSDVQLATIFDSFIVNFPFGITLGDTWEWELPGTNQHNIVSLESFSETVEVPVGTFDDCMMIQVTVTDTLGDILDTGYEYYAQSVGRVLSVNSMMGRQELIEYSIQTSVEEGRTTETPVRFNLKQNYPNPFNPVTIINYQVPIPAQISIKVYNIIGQEIATVVSEFKKPGNYSVQWNATGLNSGIYLYQIVAGDYSETKKCVLLK